MRLEVQQSIMNRAFRDNKVPFVQEEEEFHWSGTTKVTSKNTGKVYNVEVKLSLRTNSRLAGQVSTCLVKPEGVRMEDLMIAGIIDPKLDGSIDMTGIPKDKFETSLGKFIKKLNKPEA